MASQVFAKLWFGYIPPAHRWQVRQNLDRPFLLASFEQEFFVRELDKQGSCEIHFGAQPPPLPPTRGNSLRHFHFRLLIAVYRWQVRGNMGLPLHFAASLQEFFPRKLKQTVEECRSGQSGVRRIGNKNMGNEVGGRGGSSGEINTWFLVLDLCGVTAAATAVLLYVFFKIVFFDLKKRWAYLLLCSPILKNPRG